jgi:hypothetical protein
MHYLPDLWVVDRELTVCAPARVAGRERVDFAWPVTAIGYDDHQFEE